MFVSINECPTTKVSITYYLMCIDIIGNYQEGDINKCHLNMTFTTIE